MKKTVHFVGSYYVCISQCTVQKTQSATDCLVAYVSKECNAFIFKGHWVLQNWGERTMFLRVFGKYQTSHKSHFLEDLNPRLHSSKHIKSGTDICLFLRWDISLLPGFCILTHPKSTDVISVQSRIKSATMKIKKNRNNSCSNELLSTMVNIIYKGLDCHCQ
jgi:hypothetical protein